MGKQNARVRAGLFAALFSIPLLCSGQETKAPAKKSYGNLDVYYLDVYQGDATVIFTPGGKTILIDGGQKKGRYTTFDAGERVVLPFLRSKGVRKIDTVIATHPDFDHIGGLQAVLKSDLRIGEFLDPGKSHTSGTYKYLMELVKNREGLSYRNPKPGEMLDWGRNVKARVVNSHSDWDDNNECSLAIQLAHGAIVFLFTGDAEDRAERFMVERFKSGLRSHIYKAGHHGSRGSSSNFFLRTVKPLVTVISCGRNNKYSHPHEETLQRLAAAESKVCRTDEDGTIRITSDGYRYSIRENAWRPPPKRKAEKPSAKGAEEENRWKRRRKKKPEEDEEDDWDDD